MKGKYCRSCGKKKKLTWPKGKPQVCTMRCAAWQLLTYADTGDVECAHCTYCGDVMMDCTCRYGERSIFYEEEDEE